jgi:hypothetical protein
MDYQIEEVYTGGGCDQLEVRFLAHNVQFNIQVCDDQSIPKNGDDFCFILCKLGSTACDDYIEISESFENFNESTIVDFCRGYLAAKGIKKDSNYFELSQIDFMSLSIDMANNCDAQTLIVALYSMLTKFDKTELIEYMGNTFGNGALINLTSYIKGSK